ncbi:IlvD/Edd family dehydratase [Pseudomonas fluorescens]|uniref:Dihydroxy-acid dehydratase family protein n=1 Tax=Pseudomonas fluorescens TaxID=294 RepID=A0A944DMJ4_PSEFL|nr:IlvD/Edd family dehydratase [Pseudomonas fluorescens]MBT2297418.1 dihydroxy-acid dehydratase family protein [Pseudomonas fluorescens]MBT2305616.1 dihydroxy-acid dehydratase family protein [Pseudomonas fluorescens]MBT2314361.1 dihydroxy-acid dehydratase family protein [Pseudomonas fluorescens]MBT2319147.1 dihydroxy-acid dehydratase family protein [Pseudomonas fluorescens]MBT2328580.1 dihydroxy-acid dehydratase family protein [Pseudomonas fluorescens]
MTDTPKRRLRSEQWFNDPAHADMTALYVERYMNYGMTRQELQSGRPIIGIAQTGSDLTPCNRHHLELAQRVKAGIRDAGGIPMEFPVHPIAEQSRRPTAALDRNLAYLGLVEILHGYPLDGVVLTTGCDKTTPACLMAAATTDLPAIVLSGGPMLDGHHKGELIGSGTVLWHARNLMAAGDIDYEGFMEMTTAASPSVGHCNTMGTALSMNALAEALGMSLPGCASIPAPYRERGQMAYATGKRICELVLQDVRPSQIMTREAFENAIAVASALGASSNCPPHLIAIARHMGVDLSLDDWQRIGEDVPLLVNCMPAGKYLGEGFHRAGGVPAVMHELQKAGRLHEDCATVSGKTIGEIVRSSLTSNADVIYPFDTPLKHRAGFIVLSGNFFDSAIMKMSVVGEAFRKTYLSEPGAEDSFEARAIVFEGPEDYHARIDDPALDIDERCILVIRGVGTVGYPGSAEVVNMAPPAALIKQGIDSLPCLGDGRQSGTSASPSILNMSPEAAVGGGLALLKTNDRLKVDLNTRTVNLLIDEAEMAQRRLEWTPNIPPSQTPWQELYRQLVGQLSTGGCLEPATLHLRVIARSGEPRHSH